MSHHNSHPAIKDPGSFTTPGTLKSVFTVFAVIGVLVFAFGLLKFPEQTWFSFVHNHFYFYSLAIGGVFFAATQFVTSAMWSAPVRRLAESFSAFLPGSLVSFVVLYFGIHHLYVWSHPDHVSESLVLQGKSGYLSTGFFMVRNIVAILILWFFSKKLVGNSLAQDTSKDPALTEKNRSLSPGFLILFAIGYTMAAFDQMMSLDPHWFSTMFGVYCFAGMFYAVFALTTILTIYLKRQGALTGIVNDNHMHDLGKFMFAFTVFYAYIGFSQFMLIWYANIPEETVYYMHRFNGKWLYVSVFLLAGKFAVPFFALMPRGNKRDDCVLWYVAWFMLIAHWIDLLWVTQPEMKHGGHELSQGPTVGLIEIGVTLGFVGFFGLAIFSFLQKNKIVAIGDPKLTESVFEHDQ